MVFQGNVAKQAGTATKLGRKGRACGIATPQILFGVLVRSEVGAPASIVLRNGEGIVFEAEIPAQTIGLVYAGVCSWHFTLVIKNQASARTPHGTTSVIWGEVATYSSRYRRC
jgi:hypothetical protein